MKKKNIGSSFDDFLEEEAMLDEATAVAVKRVIAWQIDHEMKAQKLTKSSMAKKMHTSRAALNRLLDATDTSLTLTHAAPRTRGRLRAILGNVQFGWAISVITFITTSPVPMKHVFAIVLSVATLSGCATAGYQEQKTAGCYSVVEHACPKGKEEACARAKEEACAKATEEAYRARQRQKDLGRP